MKSPSLDAVARAAALIRGASGACVAFTGAGMSRESGIPTFRDPGGVWDRFPPEIFGTRHGLERAFGHRYDDFKRFVLELSGGLLDAEPHAGHRALAGLERDGLLRGVVTQNIDGLHRVAGSRAVIPLHGSLYDVRCERCGWRDALPREALRRLHQALDEARDGRAFTDAYLMHGPCCPECVFPARPDIVLFGEMLPDGYYDEAVELVSRCRCLLVIGASLEVQPAADLPFIAMRSGAAVVEVNVAPTPLTRTANLTIQSPAGEGLAAIAEALKADATA